MLEDLLRFKDLQRLGIVSSWPQLRYMQQNYSFPSGLVLGANSRAWRVSDVEQWLLNCPTESPPNVMKRAAKSVSARQAVRDQQKLTATANSTVSGTDEAA
jgi:predicted DNA-binding transcriptional regulator AlpA